MEWWREGFWQSRQGVEPCGGYLVRAEVEAHRRTW